MRRIKGFTLIELLIVVAIIAILAAIAVPNFLEAQTRAKVARVKSDQRSMATALETYYVDNNQYPAFATIDTLMDGTSGQYLTVNSAILGVNPIDDYPTFLMYAGDGIASPRGIDQAAGNFTLTTPIAYITSFFGDPFADTKGATFVYTSHNQAGAQADWILISWGPDVDEATSTDIELADGSGTVSRGVAGNSANVFVNALNTANETLWTGSLKTAENAWPVLVDATYDPTNGTISSGDVYRSKE